MRNTERETNKQRRGRSGEGNERIKGGGAEERKTKKMGNGWGRTRKREWRKREEAKEWGRGSKQGEGNPATEREREEGGKRQGGSVHRELLGCLGQGWGCGEKNKGGRRKNPKQGKCRRGGREKERKGEKKKERGRSKGGEGGTAEAKEGTAHGLLVETFRVDWVVSCFFFGGGGRCFWRLLSVLGDVDLLCSFPWPGVQHRYSVVKISSALSDKTSAWRPCRLRSQISRFPNWGLLHGPPPPAFAQRRTPGLQNEAEHCKPKPSTL